MNLRDALHEKRIGYRQLEKQSSISRAALCRLINDGEYPARIGEAETKRRLAEILRASGVDPLRVQWPRAGNGAPKRGRDEDLTAIEEVQLMQLDRDVLRLFGLKSNPFLNDIEEDGDVYKFKGYEQVDAAIRDAIEQRGFLAVTGESGSGKTTIWDGIESEYGGREDTVICRPQVKSRETLTPEHLARCLIYGLNGDGTVCRANAEDRGRQLSAALRAIRNEQRERKAVLLIDDAHFCGTSVLRQLKTFYEEKIGRYRLLAIILIGLPALKTKLAEFPEIGNRIRLTEVPAAPVREYLEFKLRRVGSGVDKLFDAAGFEAFCERFKQPRKSAMARPLVINACCIRAMVMLAQNGAAPGERITRELVDQMPGVTSARRVA